MPRFPKRWRAIAAVLSLPLVLLLGQASSAQSRATAGGTATLNCGTTTVHCHALRLGVNEDWATSHYGQPDLGAARQAGLGWLRFPWSWADTQPNPGDWQWGLTDRIMAAAKQAGERVIFKPQGSPCWAHPSVPCSTPGTVPPDPAYLPEWRAYIRAVLARYPDTIAAVEVWNEENIQPYWAAPISPARFVGVLKGAYTAVKSAAPNMKVIYGGLSPATRTDSTHMDYRQFLRATLAKGAAGYFDALAIHPYVAGAGGDYLDRVSDLIDSVARIARAHGEAGVPIWVTEFGYASGSGLSPGTQAARIWATLDLLAHTPGVPVAIIHRMYDPTGDALDYGLLDPGGNPKPAYRAVSSWTGCGRVSPTECDAPDTLIDTGPSGRTSDPTPRFGFHSSKPDSSFQCRMDALAFTPCASPRTLAPLDDGRHRFRVRATDGSGNVDPVAASRSFVVRTASVRVVDGTLTVIAAPGAKDDIAITRPSASTVRVRERAGPQYTGSGVHAGPECVRRGDHVANCDAAAITDVRVLSRDRPDRIVNATSFQSTLNGGAARDLLIGGSRDDRIVGGTHADIMRGRNGNDVLLAKNLVSDTLINCDGGTVHGTADRAKLDALPRDPGSSIRGCEIVRR